MEGKVAIVTGGGSGIGRATALAFARRGARIVIADILVQEGEDAVKVIKDVGGEATFIKTDVSKASDVEAMVSRTIESYGRLDYAFNNAGIEGVQAPTADFPEDAWDRVIDINLQVCGCVCVLKFHKC